MNKQCQKSRRENMNLLLNFLTCNIHFQKHSVLFSEFISDDFNSRRPCFFLALLIRCCSSIEKDTGIIFATKIPVIPNKRFQGVPLESKKFLTQFVSKLLRLERREKSCLGHSVRCFTICTSAKVKSTAVLPSKVSATNFFLILRWKLTIFKAS